MKKRRLKKPNRAKEPSAAKSAERSFAQRAIEKEGTKNNTTDRQLAGLIPGMLSIYY